MYKHNNIIRLESSKRHTLWIKRKLMLFITAFMIGMSNGMNVVDETALRKKHQTEQQDKKD
jgi:hypothetical protein